MARKYAKVEILSDEAFRRKAAGETSEGEILESGSIDEINASSNQRIHQFLNML